ncbi:MAG: septal ring lytic transglycosylase RlpA family protein [Chromatiaceae bacterium]|nr:septal ring lytic transglycosylase RlpA family protein [Chromatiaceae bacterium]
MIDENQWYGTCAVFGSTLRSAFLGGGLLIVLSGCAVTAGIDGVAVETAGVQEDVVEAAPPAVKPRSRGPASYVVLGKRYQVKPTSEGYVERGLASWYGPKFHGRRTSSGERYDMHAMTAAHKTLPLPTYAEVVNLQNGRSAVVKINDRGPFKDGRVVDLSYAAAKELGVVKPGVAMVEVRAIDPAPTPASSEAGLIVAAADPPPAPQPAAAVAEGLVAPAASTPVPSPVLLADADSGTGGAASGVYLQVGAFGDRLNAEELRKRLVRQLAEQVHVRTADGSRAPLYKVHVGPLPSRKEARDVSQQLASLGLTDARVVQE